MSGRPIPSALQADAKVKLRNSLIWWDRKGHEIWLRPRGLNLIQLPNVVARLNVSPDDRAIVGYDVRLSPVPVVFAASMLLIFHRALSTAFTVDTWVPLAFYAFVVVGLIAVGFAMVRIARLRVEALVEDALQDIRQVGAATVRQTGR